MNENISGGNGFNEYTSKISNETSIYVNKVTEMHQERSIHS